MHGIQYATRTDAEILEEIGRRLTALRKARGLTQEEAAAQAVMSRNTLYHAEHGDNPTLHTVIRLLRIYGALHALDRFIPAPEISPMARLEARRASRDG